jgi:hypothetical protein
MWNMKCMLIPEVTGAIGIVTKVLKKNFEGILGKNLIDSLQKKTLLRTSYILLQSET